MKKSAIRSTTLMFISVFIAGCNTFFEQDISNRTVNLISPAAGISTDVKSQTFLWESVDGASQYRLQIVTPSFDSAKVLVMDTLLMDTTGTANKIKVTLYPSDFEWRVRGENSAWKTNWTTSRFEIYSDSDLTRQKVNIVSPGLITNTTYNGFGWDQLNMADSYSFVVYKDRWDGILAVQPTLMTTTFLGIALSDGKYVWGVKAKNPSSETPDMQKSLIVDTTPPAIAVLTSPSDSSVVIGTTISFVWNSSDMTSGIAQDTLKVFSDKGLKSLVKSFVSNSKTATISFTDHITYYWTVRSVDNAGNVSKVSSPFKFTIN
jgi:hypothetical protein